MDVQSNRKKRGKVNEQQEEEKPKEDDVSQMNKTDSDIGEIKNEKKEVDTEIEREMKKEEQIENQMKEMEYDEKGIRELENDDKKENIKIDQKEVREFEEDKDKIKKTEIAVNIKEEEIYGKKHDTVDKEKIKNDTDCLITEDEIYKFEKNVIKQKVSKNEERKEELEYENKKVNDYHTEEVPLTYFLTKQKNCDTCNKIKSRLEKENETNDVSIDTNNERAEHECYISNTQNEKGKGNKGVDKDITKEERKELICEQTVADNYPHTFLREQKDSYKKEEDNGMSKYIENINIRNRNDNIIYLKNENENTQFVNNFMTSTQYKHDKSNILIDGYKQMETNNTSKNKCNNTPKGKTVYFDTKQITVKQYTVPTNNIPTNNIPTNNIPTNNIPTNNIPTKETENNTVAITNAVTNGTKNNNSSKEKRNRGCDTNISTNSKGKGKMKMKVSKENKYNVNSEDTLLLVKFLCQAKSYNLIKLSKVFLSKKITHKFFDEQNILSVFLSPENAVKNFCSSEDIYKIDNLNIKKNMNHTNTKYIFFIFKNGSVVIWENFKNVENNNFFINKMIVFINSFSNELLPLHIVQYDTIYYCEHHKKKCSINGGVIYLTNDCLEQKLTVSFALSQSIRLDVHETTMDIAINTLFSISKEIAAKGSCNITKEKVSNMHNIYSSIINVNAVQDFLDIPEYFWNKVQYEHLWFEVDKYLTQKEKEDMAVFQFFINHCFYLLIFVSINFCFYFLVSLFLFLFFLFLFLFPCFFISVSIFFISVSIFFISVTISLFMLLFPYLCFYFLISVSIYSFLFFTFFHSSSPSAAQIYQYLEIPERIKILNKRYDYYKDFLKVITTELYNKKTFHCYWIVVLLLFIHIFILILNDIFFMK